MDNKEVIYYSDELNDEFSSAKIDPKKIDESYKYEHKNVFWNIARMDCSKCFKCSNKGDICKSKI